MKKKNPKSGLRYDPLNIEKRSPDRNPLVATLAMVVSNLKDDVWRRNHPMGRMNKDPYFEFNEELVLPLPVTIRVILDYLLVNPKLLMEESLRQKRKKIRDVRKMKKRKRS